MLGSREAGALCCVEEYTAEEVTLGETPVKEQQPVSEQSPSLGISMTAGTHVLRNSCF